MRRSCMQVVIWVCFGGSGLLLLFLAVQALGPVFLPCWCWRNLCYCCCGCCRPPSAAPPPQQHYGPGAAATTANTPSRRRGGPKSAAVPAALVAVTTSSSSSGAAPPSSPPIPPRAGDGATGGGGDAHSAFPFQEIEFRDLTVTVVAARSTSSTSSSLSGGVSAAPPSSSPQQQLSGRRRILDEVSGRLRCAELVAIVGPSGSGKVRRSQLQQRSAAPDTRRHKAVATHKAAAGACLRPAC